MFQSSRRVGMLAAISAALSVNQGYRAALVAGRRSPTIARYQDTRKRRRFNMNKTDADLVKILKAKTKRERKGLKAVRDSYMCTRNNRCLRPHFHY